MINESESEHKYRELVSELVGDVGRVGRRSRYVVLCTCDVSSSTSAIDTSRTRLHLTTIQVLDRLSGLDIRLSKLLHAHETWKDQAGPRGIIH